MSTKNFVMKRLFFLSFILGMVSCVPNSRYVYLQKNDVRDKSVTLDSAVRKYDLPDVSYRVRPEDILSIRFESLTPKEYDIFAKDMPGGSMNMAQANPLLIGELVDKNGEVPFPVVGRVKVAGLTVFEIQNKLQVLADEYLEAPIVKVRLLNFRITFLGEVNREGTIVLNNNRASLLETLSMAGGLTDLADRSKVKVIRQVNDETTVQYVNLLDEDFVVSPFYYVSQGDIIVVPSLRQRPFRKYFGTNVSLVVSTVSVILLIINLSVTNKN